MARIYTAGIIRRGERFLCIYHRKMQCWLFAGGKLEDGEKASDCMVRELREELGIEVSGLEFFRGYLSEKNGTEWVGLFYTIYGFDGEPTILEPSECSDLQWFTVAEMRQHSASHPEMGLAEYLRECGKRAEEVAALENEVQRLKKQSDRWMIDFGIECAKVAALEAKITELNAHIAADDMARLDWSHSKDVIAALEAENDRLRNDTTERAAQQLCHMCRDGHPVKRYPGGWFHDTLNEPSVYGSWPFGCDAGAVRIAAEQPNPAQDKEQE